MRNRAQIQRFHDILEFVESRGSLPDILEPALDVLCWVLEHHKGNSIAELIEDIDKINKKYLGERDIAEVVQSRLLRLLRKADDGN